MEPGFFLITPIALLFFWLSWLCLKQSQKQIKDGELQLKTDDSEVAYIKREKNPIAFYLVTSFVCVFGCTLFFI